MTVENSRSEGGPAPHRRVELVYPGGLGEVVSTDRRSPSNQLEEAMIETDLDGPSCYVSGRILKQRAGLLLWLQPFLLPINPFSIFLSPLSA